MARCGASYHSKLVLICLYLFLLQENEEFFELLTSKFLAESRYSVSVQAATTRLLFSCSLTWMVWL